MAGRMKHARVPGADDVHLTWRRGGAAVGTVKARVRSGALLRSVLSPAARRPDEIPFALDGEGRLYAADPAQEARLKALGLTPSASEQPVAQPREDWVVVSRKDPGSGLTLGIARPVGEGLKEIRRTAVRNLALGVGIVGLALVAVVVISGRMTRDLDELALGAARLGHGELEARVPVRSRDEIGRLAETFNRMAGELRSHQEQLLEQERLRKELEMCRRIQEEMLPHDALRVPFAEVMGVSLPAREVGGDFFNYFLLPGGDAALLVGDVSGKGVPAALLMANVQATLRARLPVEPGLGPLATALDEELATGAPAYLTLFLAVLAQGGGALRYVNAGHNPPLLLHPDGRVEPLPATGRPLGLYPGGGYEERAVALRPGSTLFLYTDGLVEAEDESGEAFGLERLQALLLSERQNGPDAILAVVEDAVRAHRGGAEAMDDATLVALRVG
jgi:sigma-B regulation protein RsbU (phosphoserine phosphatase)